MPERHVLGETKQQNQIGSEISITEREVSGFSNSTENSAQSNTVSDANIRKSGNEDQWGPTFAVVAWGCGSPWVSGVCKCVHAW